MIRLATALIGLLVGIAARLALAPVVGAECIGVGNAWPAFSELAPTVQQVVIGHVAGAGTKPLGTLGFRLVIEEVLRGPKIDRLDVAALRPPPPTNCPDVALRPRAGDVLALAIGDPDDPRRASTVAVIAGGASLPAGIGIERLSRTEIHTLMRPSAPGRDHSIWVAVQGPPTEAWPTTTYVLQVGSSSWPIGPRAGGGTIADLFREPVSVRLLEAATCSAVVRFTAVPGTRWMLRFQTGGSTPVLEDWTGRGMDTGAALRPGPGSSCRPPDTATELPVVRPGWSQVLPAVFVGIVAALLTAPWVRRRVRQQPMEAPEK